MKRRDFLKLTLGAAAIPLVPAFAKRPYIDLEPVEKAPILSVEDIRAVARKLEAQSVPAVKGSYIGWAHPDVAEDLKSLDPFERIGAENVTVWRTGNSVGKTPMHEIMAMSNREAVPFWANDWRK